MAKKQPIKISVEDFAKKGTIKSRRNKPVSPSYLYRLIRQHHAGERESIPFAYVMEGEKDRIFIVEN
jgi:hypothetical protein